MTTNAASDIEPVAEAVIANYRPAALPKKKKPRQVFVAYSYRLYNKQDYRRAFKALSDAFDVHFVFADEEITTLHILEKIRNYITESQFGIYDISGWNPNVTLELGLAFGLGEPAYVVLDPSKTGVADAPSDLRGIDRLQYDSYSQLEERVGQLLAQALPVPRTHQAENALDELRDRALSVTSPDDGLKIADIASLLGVSTALAQVVVRPLVGRGLRTEGQRRGTKYFREQ